MKRWYCLLACSLFALLVVPVADASCWHCGTSNGCCGAQVQGQFGWGVCTAVQVCFSPGCGCINCRESGSFCAGTAPPQCPNQHGACEEHQSLRALPDVVPNGEPMNLLWLIDPPSTPSAVTAPSLGCAASA